MRILRLRRIRAQHGRIRLFFVIVTIFKSRPVLLLEILEMQICATKSEIRWLAAVISRTREQSKDILLSPGEHPYLTPVPLSNRIHRQFYALRNARLI